jgi:hypothetical protein
MGRVLSAAVALVTVLLIASRAAAFIAPHTTLSVRVLAHKDECFYEDVTLAGTKVFMHFAVTTGGQLDIDVNVFGPDNQLIWAAEKEMEARILFKARIAGPHKFCFSNRMSTITAKTVTFAIHVGDSMEADKKDGLIDPMTRSLMHVVEGLTEIKNEQKFLRVRELEHRSTAESTNTRVLIWSFAEIALIVGLAAGQIWYLVSRFEKRRNV